MKYVAYAIVAGLGLWFLGHTFGLFDEAAQVAHDEVGPRALLKKYQWFKDASAELDAKRANIEAAKQRPREMSDSYGELPRAKWMREDREQYNLWESEVAGLVANYNGLCAEYNANMAKANWNFTNAGDLPAGADKVLPREYRNYDEGNAK